MKHFKEARRRVITAQKKDDVGSLVTLFVGLPSLQGKVLSRCKSYLDPGVKPYLFPAVHPDNARLKLSPGIAFGVSDEQLSKDPSKRPRVMVTRPLCVLTVGQRPTPSLWLAELSEGVAPGYCPTYRWRELPAGRAVLQVKAVTTVINGSPGAGHDIRESRLDLFGYTAGRLIRYASTVEKRAEGSRSVAWSRGAFHLVRSKGQSFIVVKLIEVSDSPRPGVDRI